MKFRIPKFVPLGKSMILRFTASRNSVKYSNRKLQTTYCLTTTILISFRTQTPLKAWDRGDQTLSGQVSS